MSALLWEWEKCLGQRTGAGAMWLKNPSPKDGQRWWLGSSRAAPGYSSPGGMCHRRKGDIVCGYSKENTTPDGRDEVGMLQTPNKISQGREERELERQINQGERFLLYPKSQSKLCVH